MKIININSDNNEKMIKNILIIKTINNFYISLLIIFILLCLSEEIKLNRVYEIEISLTGKGNQKILSDSFNEELPN